MNDTLKTLAGEEWMFQSDLHDNEATIVKHDKARRGGMIGPIAKVPLCMTVDDGEGEEAFDMDCQDGRNLIAVVLLPQFAELLTWASERIEAMKDEERTPFIIELQRRCDWIAETINEREPFAYPDAGTNGSTCFMRFGGRF